MRSVVLGLLLAGCLTAPSWAQNAAAGNAAAGAKDFMICRACHEIGPGAKNMVGPVLNGVVGRHSGIYPGYAYSEANKKSGIVWTVPELEKYLANPQKVVPHTKMIFPGFKDPQKVKDVVAFLEQYGPDGQKKP